MGQVLHVDCDCFFAAVEMRDQPQYRHVPLAIGGTKDRRGVISTCNYLAREFGVRSAMATSQALSLCPTLQLLPGNMAKYREVSAQVMEILQAYAVSFQQVSVDEAYIQLSSTSNGVLIAQQIRQQVQAEVGITVSVGVAPNKFLAKVASDWRKPNGQFVIQEDEVLDFVATLPVGKIPGVGPKSVDRLKLMGLHTCQHVRDVPKHWLLERFGRFGQLLHDRAHGRDDRQVKTDRVRKTISIERTFAQDIMGDKEVAAAMEVMWPRFIQRVKGAGLSLSQLAPFVKVKYADFEVTTLANHEFNADLDDYRELLIQACHRKEKAIRLIGMGGRLKKSDIQQLCLPL